jgi:hypothetical protein
MYFRVEVNQEIFEWRKGIASQSTFSWFFRKFTGAQINGIFLDLIKKFWSRIEINKLTIDIDSTVISRCGEQEGSEVGYNPAQPGRPLHHPLLAFCDELKMVVNCWMTVSRKKGGGQFDRILHSKHAAFTVRGCWLKSDF